MLSSCRSESLIPWSAIFSSRDNYFVHFNFVLFFCSFTDALLLLFLIVVSVEVLAVLKV